MRIRVRIYSMNSTYTYLTIWINGGAISKPGAICLRNEEVAEFISRLTIPAFTLEGDTEEITRQLKSGQSEWKGVDAFSYTEDVAHALEWMERWIEIAEAEIEELKKEIE